MEMLMTPAQTSFEHVLTTVRAAGACVFFGWFGYGYFRQYPGRR